MSLSKKPTAIHTASLTITMDDGALKKFDAYRVQYSMALGPTKGGVRYHPEVTLAEVTELARLMSLKCSLAGLPYGGAKGGITVDPAQLSKSELEKLTRAYVRAFQHVFGPKKDIPAPDVNTSAETMGWFVDEWNTIVGFDDRAVVTGKPLILGGSLGRDEATGLGGVYVLEALRKTLGKEASEMRIAIQGFGNVGSFFAQRAVEKGYVVVAVSDASGGVYSASGVPVSRMRAHDKKDKFSACDTCTKITNDELLALDVDALIPAALSHVINEKNISTIKTKYIVEMANGPIDLSIDAELHARGVTVVPDVLANAGGVIVSYFEWVQNNTGEYWDLDTVRVKLARYMESMFTRVHTHAQERRTSLRESAYAFAEERIHAAEQARTSAHL
ncbi:MAG: Glu/Leu/Phe/Val dehydrogenase [Minisyncoccia bacterium]